MNDQIWDSGKLEIEKPFLAEIVDAKDGVNKAGNDALVITYVKDEDNYEGGWTYKYSTSKNSVWGALLERLEYHGIKANSPDDLIGLKALFGKEEINFGYNKVKQEKISATVLLPQRIVQMPGNTTTEEIESEGDEKTTTLVDVDTLSDEDITFQIEETMDIVDLAEALEVDTPKLKQRLTSMKRDKKVTIKGKTVSLP